ncbi:MAG: methyltransferase domain-containing protein [Anaerolineae bacterium]|jgi:demethylmenaquinone methyltransferase/2-methoxy-6-polyprenyl-1,4-benzoquinol methylase
MKVLESAPERYERGMRLLTLGRLERVWQDIAAQIDAGAQVLDVGCGTGALAVRLAEKGAHVTGIDVAPQMLSQAAAQLEARGLADRVRLLELGAVEIDGAFAEERFDVIVSALVFSEFSTGEAEYVLNACRRVLRPEGRLLVADEILPDAVLGRLVTYLVRLPFALLAYLLTQNTTHRVAHLDEQIESAGFRIVETKGYLAGTLKLFVAEKVDWDA